jgi:hypothetical protein
MADKPTPGGAVPMTGAAVPMHKRIAAGSKENGQTLPGSPGAAAPKTPA